MNILLMTVGFILILWGLFDLRKKVHGKNDFMRKYSKAIENTDDIDIEIGKLRNEFSETILELQKEIYALKEEKSPEETYEEKHDIKKDIYVKSEKAKNRSKEGNEISLIKELFQEGKSIEEICSITKMNKGEVLLVKELYI